MAETNCELLLSFSLLGALSHIRFSAHREIPMESVHLARRCTERMVAFVLDPHLEALELRGHPLRTGIAMLPHQSIYFIATPSASSLLLLDMMSPTCTCMTKGVLRLFSLQHLMEDSTLQ